MEFRSGTATDKKRVKKLIEQYVKELHVEHIALTLEYEILDIDKPERIAQTYLNHPYLNATITLYSEFWEQTEEAQAKILRHEVVHLLTIPFKILFSKVLVHGQHVAWREVEELEEQTCDWIANILHQSIGVKSDRTR